MFYLWRNWCDANFVLADGRDEEEAFCRGRRGKALPFASCAPRAPLFDALYGEERNYPSQAEKTVASVVFRRYRGWAPADEAGIVLRFDHHMLLQRGEWDRDPAFLDGRVGVRMRDREFRQRIFAALAEPGAPLREDPNFGPWGLGPEPEYAAACVRAMAIQLLAVSEGCDLDRLQALRVPKRKAGNLRRFLFFTGRGLGLGPVLTSGSRTESVWVAAEARSST